MIQNVAIFFKLAHKDVSSKLDSLSLPLKCLRTLSVGEQFAHLDHGTTMLQPRRNPSARSEAHSSKLRGLSIPESAYRKPVNLSNTTVWQID